MKKLFLVLFVLSLCSSTLFAQMNREDLEEALKYFPAGICGSIAHVDDQALANSKIFNKYRGAFSVNYGRPKLNVLPLSLRSDVLSRSQADKTRLQKFSGEKLETVKFEDNTFYTVNKESLKKIKGEVSGEFHFSEVVDEKAVYCILVNVANQYRVYRYNNLEEKIKTALKNGELVPLGKKIAERAVYQFAFTDHRDKKLELLAYPTLNNELLVARDLQNIKVMLDAGNGSIASIIEDQEYRDLLLGLSGKMTASWGLWIPDATSKLRLQHLEQNGGDPEQIANTKTSLECGLTYHFTSESFDGNNEIFKKITSCNYPVEKASAIEIEPFAGFSQWPDHVNDFYKELEQYQKHSIDKKNNILTITKTYNEKILAKQVEINKVTRKLRAERKAKREAEKAKKEAADSN